MGVFRRGKSVRVFGIDRNMKNLGKKVRKCHDNHHQHHCRKYSIASHMWRDSILIHLGCLEVEPGFASSSLNTPHTEQYSYREIYSSVVIGFNQCHTTLHYTTLHTPQPPPPPVKQTPATIKTKTNAKISM